MTPFCVVAGALSICPFRRAPYARSGLVDAVSYLGAHPNLAVGWAFLHPSICVIAGALLGERMRYRKAFRRWYHCSRDIWIVTVLR